MAAAVHTQAEEANGAAAQASRGLSAPPVPTGEPGGGDHQSHSSGLGELLRHRPLKPVLLCHQALGGAEDTAPLDACQKTSGLWLGAVEYGMDSSHIGVVCCLSCASGSAYSPLNCIGLITLAVKQPGERSAGNPLAAFDVAGAGNVVTSFSLMTTPARQFPTRPPWTPSY